MNPTDNGNIKYLFFLWVRAKLLEEELRSVGLQLLAVTLALLFTGVPASWQAVCYRQATVGQKGL